MKSKFYYEDGQDNGYDEQGNITYDPMEEVFTQIDDPNIVLEILTSQTEYYKKKPAEKLSKRRQNHQRSPV